jgi:hypothetical protein
MTSRFTLDEGKAAEWVARSIAAYESGTPDGPDEPLATAIYGDWSPSGDGDESYPTEDLVHQAQEAGIIAGRAGDHVEYEPCTDGGYQWIVYVGLERMGAPLRLASGYSELYHLGGYGAQGAAAALAVLREAVEAANIILDDLDAYVAARTRPGGA